MPVFSTEMFKFKTEEVETLLPGGPSFAGNGKKKGKEMSMGTGRYGLLKLGGAVTATGGVLTIGKYLYATEKEGVVETHATAGGPTEFTQLRKALPEGVFGRPSRGSLRFAKNVLGGNGTGTSGSTRPPSDSSSASSPGSTGSTPNSRDTDNAGKQTSPEINRALNILTAKREKIEGDFPGLNDPLSDYQECYRLKSNLIFGAQNVDEELATKVGTEVKATERMLGRLAMKFNPEVRALLESAKRKTQGASPPIVVAPSGNSVFRREMKSLGSLPGAPSGDSWPRRQMRPN